MKKAFYLCPGSDTDFMGVNKKIDNQIKAFRKIADVDKVVIQKESTNLFKSIIWRLPFGSMGMQYDKALKEIDTHSQGHQVTFFYLRTQYFDRRYVGFLASLRKRYNQSKIILEIPTYPYDREILSEFTMWPWFLKDKIYSIMVKRYIDRITTLSDDDCMFGIETIRIMNGIDVRSIFPARADGDDCDISLIAVAMMQPYHGYERLIHGLNEYYESEGKLNIHIHFVGYGSELTLYQDLVRKYHLEKKVFFDGKLDGNELDAIYDRCDLAVGSLGGYKIGINKFSSIKLSEYLAKGLPVITGAPTSVFDKYGGEYNLEFPNDGSSIDLYAVIDFYHKIYDGRGPYTVHMDIHNFAIETVDIYSVLKPVTDYIDICE